MNSNELSDIDGLANPAPVVDDNTANIERHLFALNPVTVSGVATTTIGAPTAGTFALNQLWWDANGALFKCTVAGTPGTWVQLTPAPLAADPGSGTIPTGYLIRRTDLDGLVKVHAGSYAWQPVRAVLDAFAVADLPAAASHTNRLVVCTNGDAGARCLALSDGSNWKRIALGSNVSAT